MRFSAILFAVLISVSAFSQPTVTGPSAGVFNVPVANVPVTYLTAASTFNGSSQYLTNTISSMPWSSVGTLSLWFQLSAGNSAKKYVLFCNAGFGPSQSYFLVNRYSDNHINVAFFNSGGTQFAEMQTSATFTDTGWHHLYADWDITNVVHELYIDGTNALGVVTPWGNGSSPWSTYHWRVGADTSPTPLYYGGCLIGLWMGTNRLSAATYVSSFRSSDGHAIDLGATGTVGGCTPNIWMPLNNATPTLNEGSGGNFTLWSGPLSSCVGPP